MIILLPTAVLSLVWVAASSNVDLVNPLIGNTGPEPNFAGGMIPSVAPPFGMTRWVAQTHQNYVSRLPYNYSDSEIIHGFVGTHQPAIWMGESGMVGVVPGLSSSTDGKVKARFEERGLRKRVGSEKFGVSLYEVELEIDGGGNIDVAMTATSRVGHFRFTFKTGVAWHPYILLQSSRPSELFHSTPTASHFNISYPDGWARIFPEQNRICGYNSEMQDWVIAPVSSMQNVENKQRDGRGHGGFKGWFCAVFDREFDGYGVTQGSEQRDRILEGLGEEVGAFARFEYPSDQDELVVDVRIAVSFISMEQALVNLEEEVPQGTPLETTEQITRAAWEEKLDRVEVEGGKLEDRRILITSVFHALQYPYEQHEYGKYYSAYDDEVHDGESYNGYSIWDTYRAEWDFLLLFAPERIPGMIQSMLQDYKEGGWLPMWKNIVETNIMIATHADSLITEAILKGFEGGFDVDLVWEAVWKDATIPPEKDWEVKYEDREEDVDYEVRAGLSSSYADPKKGWVDDDIHSESVSRTLGYAYDDHALSLLSAHLNKSPSVTSLLHERSMRAPWLVWNSDATSVDDYVNEEDKIRFNGMTKGFVQGRNVDGSWADPTSGFTEGDKWAYSFDIVHDIPGLIEKRGGKEAFVQSLNEHYDGGWDWFGNEPSHHIPYLYTLAGRPDLTQHRVREIARANYNDTPQGLSGNEDCGQMSAWYIFGALGFYPVNPVSKEFVIGSPFFDKLTLHLPSPEPDASPFYDAQRQAYTLTVEKHGDPEGIYVKSVAVNGEEVDLYGGNPIIRWEDIYHGGNIDLEMSKTPVFAVSDDTTGIVHEEL
ncbi:glycoside hydrolase family 92 protein [Armillaria nabsnona]|nr:glycoside hydrolase family 92 protein [Armillaria nabsnona]